MKTTTDTLELIVKNNTYEANQILSIAHGASYVFPMPIMEDGQYFTFTNHIRTLLDQEVSGYTLCIRAHDQNGMNDLLLQSMRNLARIYNNANPLMTVSDYEGGHIINIEVSKGGTKIHACLYLTDADIGKPDTILMEISIL